MSACGDACVGVGLRELRPSTERTLGVASRFTWSIQMQHSLQGCRKRHAGLLALIILMAGCRNPAENGDPRACQQRTGISSPVGSRAPAKRDTRV